MDPEYENLSDSDEDEEGTDHMDFNENEDYAEEDDEDENQDPIMLCRETTPHLATVPRSRTRFQDYHVTRSDLVTRQDQIKDARTNLQIDRNTVACLKLQNLLHKSNCSMSVFDKVMDWAQEYKDDIYSNISNPSHSQLWKCTPRTFLDMMIRATKL